MSEEDEARDASETGTRSTCDAAERQARRWERIARASEKSARATERSANAIETLTVLINSVIGSGRSYCYPAESTGFGTTHVVNYVRTGRGDKNFGCDRDDDEDAD